MNKDNFLKELGKHLAILESSEQADILGEYSQHIDIKISNGLSEEEATRDFGSVSELAAEILEAYHVNPEYQKVRSAKYIPNIEKATEEGKKAYGSIVRLLKWLSQKCKTVGASILKLIKALFRSIASIPSIPGKLHNKIKERKSVAYDINADDVNSTNTVTNNMNVKSTKSKRSPNPVIGFVKRCFYSLKHLLKLSFIFIYKCLYWCIKLAWNAFLLFISIFSGMCTLVSLFVFALMITLIFQGYPVKGLTLIMMGTVACSGSFTVFCASFLPFKRVKGKEKDNDKGRADNNEIEEEIVLTANLPKEVHNA